MNAKFKQFLEGQKQRLLMLDGAAQETGWLTEKEQRKTHWSHFDEDRGRTYGLMEAVYDNTINWIMAACRKMGRVAIDEKTGQPTLVQEDTLSTAIATFVTGLLPGVRRLFQDMVALELVSTQPLNGPSGYIWYLDHLYTSTYADSKDTITALDRLDQKRPINYAAGSEQGAIREIQVKLTSKLVSTVIQKLKADWTLESEQDMRSQWKLDVENELIPELTNECLRETDRRIIEALYAAAAYNVDWNKNGSLGAGSDTTSDVLAYRQTLYSDAMTLANAYVLGKKYTGVGWAVLNPTTFQLLQRLENFKLDPNAGRNMTSTIGTVYVGTINGMIKVYIAPWFYDNKILMGIKGDTWKTAVGYYAPYIPLFVSDKYLIADDFTQFARGAMSRYGYGAITEESTGSTTNDGLVTVTVKSS